MESRYKILRDFSNPFTSVKAGTTMSKKEWFEKLGADDQTRNLNPRLFVEVEEDSDVVKIEVKRGEMSNGALHELAQQYKELFGEYEIVIDAEINFYAKKRDHRDGYKKLREYADLCIQAIDAGALPYQVERMESDEIRRLLDELDLKKEKVLASAKLQPDDKAGKP